MADEMRVLELYSGIGGMHSALKLCGTAYKVVAAYDVNTNANKIYQHNFPETKVIDKGIEGLTMKTYDGLKVDMILMSPPCQPFTRVGNKQDTKDARTNSFLHILDLLSTVTRPPTYLLLENVKGFETSHAREKLVTTLTQCQYNFQEFLLTPLQFGLPNSRLRYFLIAKKQPLKFGFDTSTEVHSTLPECTADWLTYRKQAENEGGHASDKRKNQQQKCACCGFRRHSNNVPDNLQLSKCAAQDDLQVQSEHINSDNDDDDADIHTKRRKVDHVVSDTGHSKSVVSDRHQQVDPDDVNETTDTSKDSSCISECPHFESDFVCLEDYGKNMRQTHENQPDYGPVLKLHCFLEDSCDTFGECSLSDKDLRRFMVMDIVNPCSTKTNCFTKRYGRYIEGAGSLVQMSRDAQVMMQASDFKKAASAQQNSENWSPEQLGAVQNLKLRFFSPREIANLLGFPKTFGFPDGLTTRQLYMALGNSLNVHVVAVLIKLLTYNDKNVS